MLADYMSVRIGCRYPRSMPRGCIRARTSRMGPAQTSRTRDKKPHTTPLQRTHQQRPVTPGAFRLRAPEAGAWPRRAPAGRSWVWARKKEGRRNCAQTRPTRGRKSPHLWCRSPFTRVYRQQPRLLKLAARATAPRALERPRTRPKQPSPQETVGSLRGQAFRFVPRGAKRMCSNLRYKILGQKCGFQTS